MKKQKKQIRFPLEMKDGKKVNSLDELRENFSISRLREYFLDGRLTVWLRHRSLDMQAEGITNIPKEADDSLEQICRILEISISDEVMEEIERCKDKAEETEDVEEENETIEAEEVVGDTGPVEEKENVFLKSESAACPYSGNNGIWLDEGENMKEVLHLEEIEPYYYNFDLGRGAAAEGDDLYIICEIEKHSERYAIKRYNIKNGLSEIITTLPEGTKENGGGTDYRITGIRNHILVYFDNHEKEITYNLRTGKMYKYNLYTLNVLTGETKTFTLPSNIMSGWQYGSNRLIGNQSGCFLIDSAGMHIYCMEGSYNNGYLTKINLESGKNERLCSERFWLRSICDEGAILEKSESSRLDNFYFYDIKKEELNHLACLLKKGHRRGRGMIRTRTEEYYYKGEIYQLDMGNENQLSVWKYKLEAGGSGAIIKTFDLEQFSFGFGVQSIVANGKIYLCKHKRNDSEPQCPDYRIDMNEWFIEKLVKADNRLLWETYDDKKPSDISSILGSDVGSSIRAMVGILKILNNS